MPLTNKLLWFTFILLLFVFYVLFIFSPCLTYERVWVFTRDLHHLYVLKELREHFEHEQVWSKGRGMVLHLFWSGPDTELRIGRAGDDRMGRPVDSSRNSH